MLSLQIVEYNKTKNIYRNQECHNKEDLVTNMIYGIQEMEDSQYIPHVVRYTALNYQYEIMSIRIQKVF